jgi:hypothetical protein
MMPPRCTWVKGGLLTTVCLVDNTCPGCQDRFLWKCGGSKHDFSHFHSIMEQFYKKATPTLVCSWYVRLWPMHGIIVYLNHYLPINLLLILC